MGAIRLALRALLKSPVVTSVAVASLALGIGANAAIFSLFDEIVLRSLPVPAPDRLVNLSAPGPKPGSNSCGNEGGCDDIFSYPMFRDLERTQTVFTGIAAHRLFSANLSFGGQTQSGGGILVSGSYFPVLGLQPALGRLLSEGDDRIVGESPVVVLSHAYWQTRFSSSPGILNQTMVVNGQTMTIVGVAPRGFSGTTAMEQPQVFVPITMRALMQPGVRAFDDRQSYWAYLFARLKAGVSSEEARSALNVPYHAIVNDVEVPLQKGLSDQSMVRFRAKTITIEPGARGQSTIALDAKPAFVLLQIVTVVVLLIACANIANLLLARAAARTGEIAVRLSLGASRVQLVAQLLVESCLLAVFGGLAGLLVSRWTLDLIMWVMEAEATDIDVQLHTPVLLFVSAMTLGTGLIVGLFPALNCTRPDLVSTLKGQSGQLSGARAAKRFRGVLATLQIALSMALLISAGLFTRSLLNVSRIESRLERLETELGALPGVTAVTAARVALLNDDASGSNMSVEGFPAGPDTDTSSHYNEIGAGFFRALGIPLMSGREFTPADAAGAPRVVIVNESFARKFKLGRDAVGRHIGNGNQVPDILIIGLVKDAKHSNVKDTIPPLFFRPYRQNDFGVINFYVRTSLETEQLIPAVRTVMARLDANLPIENLRTMEGQVRENVATDRFVSVLAAAFASLATLLAGIGLYGVLAYSVTQRTREIGLRIALGAAPARVRNMILRQVGNMLLVGGSIGLIAAVGLGRVAESLLYRLKGYDPLVLVGSAIALSLVALAAGFVPAQRAAHVDPMQALRYE